jgi:hypothetical protein
VGRDIGLDVKLAAEICIHVVGIVLALSAMLAAMMLR